MKNEFGVKLDRNGYAPSVINLFDDSKCFFCWKSGDLARHEVFHGSNRTLSKELGCWVNLCPACHHALHKTNPELDWTLKQAGQRCVMNHYGWTVDDFRERFGRSYVEE